MKDVKIREKIIELVSLPDDQLNLWYRKNKIVAKEIIESLTYLNLERNRYGRVQFRQAVWHYTTQLMSKPKCNNVGCTNYVKWNDTKHSYQQFCSNNCVHLDGRLNNKRKQTLQQRYGIDNIFQDVERIKQSRRNKFGTDHANQNIKIQEKTKQYFLKKYGVEHPWMLPSIRKKCVTTRNYVYVSPHQKELLDDTLWMATRLIDRALTQQQVAEELGVAQSTVGLYANKHNIEFSPRSKIQIQIQQFIQKHTVSTVLSDCKNILSINRELDIFIPDLNLAFEINGVYWHGELNGKNKTYHLEKRILAEEREITLIQIYDTEWHTQQDIVKSRILSQLKTNTKIFARKCKIIQLDTKQSRLFFETNHIQGFVGSAVCFGLSYNGIIVAAMSFGKPRFNNYEYELLRYCSKTYTNIIGGPSKLFKHFIRQYSPTTVVTFGDLRWGTGKLYSHLGFTCCKENTGPKYAYFKRNEVGRTNKLLSRIQFQKHKLQYKLNTFNPNLTEWNNMIVNGYDRIWDCGNSKWEWKKGNYSSPFV